MSKDVLATLQIINQTSGVENAAECKDCGGTCCQNYAGIARPGDFGPRETLQATLESYLRTGFWCIDWWEGDPRRDGDLGCVYFIRPAHVGARGKLRDPSWGGTCILWSKEYGCSLAFENRPYECRHLVPQAKNAKGERSCRGEGKKETALAWIPFQEEIIAAMDAVEHERDGQ